MVQEALRQLHDGLGMVTVLAIGPVDLQAPLMDVGGNVEEVRACIVRPDNRPAVFWGWLQETRRGKALIQLPQIVKDHLGPGKRR